MLPPSVRLPHVSSHPDRMPSQHFQLQQRNSHASQQQGISSLMSAELTQLLLVLLGQVISKVLCHMVC